MTDLPYVPAFPFRDSKQEEKQDEKDTQNDNNERLSKSAEENEIQKWSQLVRKILRSNSSNRHIKAMMMMMMIRMRRKTSET